MRVWAALALGGALSLLAPSGAAAAEGAWDRAWGKDVITGGAMGFEICTAIASCKVGETGGLGGEMDGPNAVAADAAGNLYVADHFNNRIQKFDSNGNWERAWGKDVISGGGTGFEICSAAASCKVGESGELGGEMDGPDGVATDAAGNVYVADFRRGRIQKFDSNGTWERAWGKE